MKKLAVLGIDHGHCRAIIEAAAQRDDVELVAIAQETEPFSDEMSASLGVRNYHSYEDCLNQESPDVVGIAMYNGARGRWISESLSRGCPVISDKPLCTNMGDLETIKAARGRTNAPLCMMLTERCNPVFLALRRAINEGRIGEVVGVEGTRYYALNPAGRPWWMFEPEAYGGPAIDIVIHDYDLARWMTGRSWMVPSITCYRFGKEYDIDDACTLIAEEDGCVLSLSMFWQSPCGHHGRFAVYGTEGYVDVGPLGGNIPVLVDREGSRIELELPDSPSFAAVFFDALGGDASLPISSEESIEVMANLLR